jgi:hypothetical protein
MTYYKYAERDEASRVDWGTISKTWSDTIQKGLNERETKRGAIQTATELLTQEIIAQPEGTHRGVQEFYSDYSVNAQDILLEANRRLKSGDIKVRDYMALMANMTTDVATITGLGQYYMDNHKEISDRWANGESQEFEVKLGEVFQDHTNFTDTDVAFDPVTGKARIVKRVLNPETGLFESGSILTPAELRSAMGTRYDRYDADGAATKIASELGKTQTAILEGKIKTIEGQSEKDYIDKILDQQVEAAMTDGLHVSSVLTMDMDGYAVTFDAKEALDSPDSVLGVLNPLQPNAGEKVPLVGVIDQIEDLEGAKQEQLLDQIFGADLSKEDREELIRRAREQRDIAKGWMTEEARARFNDIETARQEFNTNTSGGRGSSAGERGLERMGENALKPFELIHGGNAAQARAGLQNLVDRNDEFADGNLVVNEDGSRGIELVVNTDSGQQLQVINVDDDFEIFLDESAPRFISEKVLPSLYEAYEDPKHRPLFEGVPGSVSVSIEREEYIDPDKIPSHTVKAMGKDVDVSEALSMVGDEGRIADQDQANQNSQLLTSLFSQLNISEAKVDVVKEETLEDLNIDDRYSAMSIDIPGITPGPILVSSADISSTVSNLFYELSRSAMNEQPLSLEEILPLLSDRSKGLNSDENREAVFNIETPLKYLDWQEQNPGGTALQYKEYQKTFN